MTKRKMTSTERELLKALARQSFYDFVHWVYPHASANWHHKTIFDAMGAVSNDELDRVILSAPPRHGKTFAAGEMLPAYYLGVHPTRKVLFATHKADLAEKALRRVKAIMALPRYKELFPHIRPGERSTVDELELATGGGIVAVGQGAGIGGRAANLLIIDDIIARREDAESETVRNKVWEWLNDEAMARLEWPGAVVNMSTRWHVDDPIGRVLAGKDAHRWQVFNFPAIMDDVRRKPSYDPRGEGEVLWPGRAVSDEEQKSGRVPPLDEQVHRMREYLETAQRTNPYGFGALYQGRPGVKDGSLFRREWMRQFYAQPPDLLAKQCDDLLISVDAAFGGKKTSDNVSMTVLGIKGANIYVLDEVCRKMTYPQTKAALKALHRRWPRAKILIEAKANGQALLDDLKSDLPRLLAFNPGRQSKESRAQLASERFEAGQIYLPAPAYAPWILDWIEDFVGFKSRPNDDRVDSLSQAVIHWQGHQGARAHLLRIVGG